MPTSNKIHGPSSVRSDLLPLVMHRFFRHGEGWAFHPSLDGSVLGLADRLAEPLRMRGGHRFATDDGPQWLVGVVRPDTQCQNRLAVDRWPTVLAAAVLFRRPTLVEVDRIQDALAARDYPQTGGPSDDLVCELLPPPPDYWANPQTYRPAVDAAADPVPDEVREVERRLAMAVRDADPAVVWDDCLHPWRGSVDGRHVEADPLADDPARWAAVMVPHVIVIDDPAWRVQAIAQPGLLTIEAIRPAQAGGTVVHVYRHWPRQLAAARWAARAVLACSVVVTSQTGRMP